LQTALVLQQFDTILNQLSLLVSVDFIRSSLVLQIKILNTRATFIAVGETRQLELLVQTETLLNRLKQPI